MKKLIVFILLLCAQATLVRGNSLPVLAVVENQAADSSRYHKKIVKADKAFHRGKYARAKRLYQRALRLEPQETYPKEMIIKCDIQLKSLKW